MYVQNFNDIGKLSACIKYINLPIDINLLPIGKRTSTSATPPLSLH